MEVTPVRGAILQASHAALLREPLLLTALAAFVGTAVGLLGTVRYAEFMVSYNFSLSEMLFATAAQLSGEGLTALSLLGIPALLGGGSRRAGMRATVVGGALLCVFALASATAFFYLWYVNTAARAGTVDAFPRLAEISFWVSVFMPPAITIPFALAALWARRARFGALIGGLCISCFPLGVIWFLWRPEDASYEPSATPWLLGLMGTGVGLPETPLWIMLGVLLLREARARSYGKAELRQAEENRKKALRLYEKGLGRCELCVVDELVSEDVRDLRSGSRGRLGMERIITDLWASYPDLSVSVERQEAEGELVRTRLLLSGTDRGGVLWYPPTGRRVDFSAEFVDRFRRGELFEHEGKADTQGLLRQLGHDQQE